MIITINEKNAAQYNALFAKAYQELAAAGKLREGMENNEGRFLSLDDYFAHMEDLLALNPTYMMLPLDETTFDINANSRAISAPKIVVLQNDQIAETIVFTIDRYFDYMDLNNAEIWVQWTAPGKNGTVREGSSRIEMKDIASVPGKIRLGWPLEEEVTEEPGVVKYSVRFWNKGIVTDDKGNEEEKVVYSFNTLTSSLTISPSLHPVIDFNEVPNAPLRDNIFKRAIRNSQITSEGVAIPLEPLFSEPGVDLNSEASLDKETNTLTLTAQAVVGDTGHVEYEWYYKPAVDVTVEGTNFNSNTFYSYEPRTVANSDGTTTELPGFKEFNGEVKEVYKAVENLEALVLGEQYYVEASDTSTSYAAYTGTTVPENTVLYERYTTYTVPEGEVKVTGEYYVEASNYIRPNTSKPTASRTCKLISPDDVVFTTNLPETMIIENGSADLKVKLIKQASDDADITYTWKKGTNSNVIDEDITDAVATSGTYTVATPGWYQVSVDALLNREHKDAISDVCKVTFMPEIPATSYGEVSGAKIDATLEGPLFTGEPATLDLVIAPFVTEDGPYAGYSPELFSEQLAYAWTVQIDENPSRFLTDSDVGTIVESGLGTPTLIVKNPAGLNRYTFKCIISNTLNGKTVTQSESDALPFYVI